MRYIKLPLIIEDEAEQTVVLNLNPFTIESYYSAVYFYKDEDALSKEVTVIHCKSGISYDIMLNIDDFEKIHNKFMAQ